MDENMNVEITRREAIKPSSQTPENLRILNLSMLDQLLPDIYVPLVFFFPFISSSEISEQNSIKTASERVQRLRETLSEVLTLYYPFAGRLRSSSVIECNDEGAEFIESKAAIPMCTVLKNPDLIALKSFLGAQPLDRRDSHGGTLLLVQATIFICGGISLGLSFSHRLGDACTMAGFVRSWAKISHENPEILVKKPEFGQACHTFPPIPDSIFPYTRSSEVHQGTYVSRRYVFTADKIASMKSILENNPTRVEAVFGLVWKCTMKASPSRTLLLSIVMNMRKRMVPPLDDNDVGNLIFGASLRADDFDQGGVSLQVLVNRLRKSINEAAETCSDPGHLLRAIQELSPEVQRAMMADELHGYSSWCRFGFYEVDFGWEKPNWVSTVSMGLKNTVVLMDAKDGYGIEAYFFVLKEEDMALIEADPDFLAYASLNPSVV